MNSKIRSRLKSPSLWLSLLCMSATPATSAVLYWDIDGATPDAGGAAPAGTWDTALTNWSLDPTGSAAPQAWVAGDTAIFAAGDNVTGATGAYTVTLSAAQTAAGLTVEEGTVSLAGSALTIGTGTVTILNGAKLSIPLTANLVATAGAQMVLDGGTMRNTANATGGPAFVSSNITINLTAAGGTVETANTGTNTNIYAGSIRGAGSTLTKTGSGEFRFQGAGTGTSTFAKLVVNQGLFRLGNVNGNNFETGFGAVPVSTLADAITLSNGATIGTSYTITLAATRGITLGTGGGGFTTSAAPMTVPGPITGSGNLIKGTSGTLTLSGTSDYTGSTLVSAGVLTVGGANALGSISGATQVSATGEIRFDGAATNFSISEPFQIAGGGANGAIFIQNSASPTISGTITLAGNSTVGVSGSASATFDNAVAFTSLANETLTLQGGSPTTGNGGTITGAITLGAGGLTKLQAGTWRLGGANTWTGATTISAGTLLVTGSVTNTSVVNVTGTLGGDGTITPIAAGNINLLALGKLSPGTSVGNLTTSLSGGGELDLTLGITAANSQSLLFELDTALSSDRITTLGGALEIGAGLLEFDDFTFTMLGGFTPFTDYTLFDGDTAISGTPGANFSGFVGTNYAELQFADGGKDLVLHVVPEPGSAALLLGGLAALAARRRRRA